MGWRLAVAFSAVLTAQDLQPPRMSGTAQRKLSNGKEMNEYAVQDSIVL